jgi:hypothetical protein
MVKIGMSRIVCIAGSGQDFCGKRTSAILRQALSDTCLPVEPAEGLLEGSKSPVRGTLPAHCPARGA